MEWSEETIPEIMRAYCDGQEWAANLVVERLFLPMLRYAEKRTAQYRLDRSHASDAAQEAFVVLLSKRSEIWQGRSPLAYLMGIVKNVIRKESRSRRAVNASAAAGDDGEPFDWMGQVAASDRSELTRLVGRERAGIIRGAFRRYLGDIDEKQAQVLDLRFTGGMEPAEIAQVTGNTRETVSVWVCRFKEYFRDWLKKNVDPRGTKFATLWRAWQQESDHGTRDGG